MSISSISYQEVRIDPWLLGIKMPQRDVYAGVDVGSSSIRVGLIDEKGELVQVETEKLDYQQSKEDPRFVTQSSCQIWEAYNSCMVKIQSNLEDGDVIKSIGCAATCSMVVMKNTKEGLVPYPVDYGFKNPDQNIVFWMDSRATKEIKDINKILKSDSILEYVGGAFIEEMGIPKAKYLVDKIPEEDIKDIVLFDLHDFLSYMITKEGSSETIQSCIDSEEIQMALDGELKGWSSEFMNKIGLGILTSSCFSAIGKAEICDRSDFAPIPYAGERVATTQDGIVVGQSLIDCYAGWIASCGKNIQHTLTMIAGTSTCFLVAHENKTPVKGIWGPYRRVFPSISVSEGGQSTTGKLFEHIFETHPAFHELQGMGSNIFETLENLIQTIEQKSKSSIHFESKNMFLYGDLSGNRTPYADGAMRGAFIGESTDKSLKDLLLKYVCALEFLAFQTRQVLETLNGHNIAKIIISGSQAKNERFVKLLALVTGLPIEVSKTDPAYSGVKGAAYLGISAYKNVPLTQVIEDLNEKGLIYKHLENDRSLENLLDAKYRVMKDMAERQRTYRDWISKSLE